MTPLAIPPSNIFFALQDAVAARIIGVEDFVKVQGLDVAQQRKGDILNQIQTSLQKIGLGLTVMTPEINPGDDGPCSLQVKVTVAIVENVIINSSPGGTRVPALDLVAAALGVLMNPPTGWAPDGWTTFIFKGVIVGDPGIASAIEYDLNFETRTLVQREP